MQLNNEMSIALALIVLFTILFAPPSISATLTIRSDVYGILTGTNYGECAIQLAPIPTSTGLSCPNPWVTLDCAGNFAGRAVARSNLDTARTALLTDSKLTLSLDDDRKIGGMCYAYQIILFR